MLLQFLEQAQQVVDAVTNQFESHSIEKLCN